MRKRVMNRKILKENQKIREEFSKSQEVKLLNLSDIILVEPVHINAKFDDDDLAKRIEKLKSKNIVQLSIPLVVKEELDGKYSLVIGYSGYMIAKSLEFAEVPCIITNEKRTELNSKLGFKSQIPINGSIADNFVPIDKITIPKKFVNVKEEKVNKCIEYYNKNGCFDKPILIRKNGLCVDGFSRLIAAKRLKLDKIEVEFKA